MISKPEPPICIALDSPDLEVAERLVDSLAGVVGVFKVGLELFTAQGPRAVEAVRARGADVFLDLKLNDIPKQVAGSVRAAAGLGATYLTVHGNAGLPTVRAAVEAAADGRPQILVVSVLTSLDDDDVHQTGIARGVSAQVDAIATMAEAERAPGITLGAAEVERVRTAHPDLFLLVPGIRPAGSGVGDQKRVGTPQDAIRAGADLIVIGRAVTQAADPVEATKRIIEEIDGVRTGARS
jgi:orotidine-5'-phosphate decarboxylase